MVNQPKEFKPFSFGTAALILILCTLFDTVGCVVLLIGGYIFSKKGHNGLAIAMVVANFIVPDALPAIDELFTLVAVVVPMWKRYQETGSIKMSAMAGAKGLKEYGSAKKKSGIQKEKSIDYDDTLD